jgi:hypothetical protein
MDDRSALIVPAALVDADGAGILFEIGIRVPRFLSNALPVLDPLSGRGGADEGCGDRRVARLGAQQNQCRVPELAEK